MGLTLWIMRLRAFASAWQDAKRPRGEDERVPTGGMYDWVKRIQRIRDEEVVADMRRMMGQV